MALALTVFALTHVYGIAANGLGYFKQFLGHAPVYMAPFMIPIEIVSHLARPLSLSLRLLGNIAADHKVVSAFFALVPLIVPVPFLILGTLVAIIQNARVLFVGDGLYQWRGGPRPRGRPRARGSPLVSWRK